MSRNQGFALIASLLILLALAMMGLGSMFLTQMNLKIAENGRTGTIARYNAESGLDTAFVLLAGEFKQNMSVPATISEFRTDFPDFESANYTLSSSNGYTVFPNGTVRIRVVGHGPRNSEYEAEALVQPQLQAIPGSTETSIFGEGFVSKQGITLNGNGTYDINFWSGGNIDIHPGKLKAGRVARAAGTICKTGGEGDCYPGQPEPQVPMPVFSNLRSEMIAKAELDFPGFSMATCDYRTGSYTGSGAVVCVPPFGTLKINGAVSNLIVIGDETTKVEINAQTGSTSNDSTPGITVASKTITFGSSAAFYGTNTIAAIDDITFGKNIVSKDEVARTFIVTEGNFTLKGTGATDMFASFWVGGTFEVNGTPDKFRGTVVANSTIIRNGGGSFHTIADPSGLDNEFIPQDPLPVYTGAGIRVLSRR